MIRFRCPHCREIIEVGSYRAGEKMFCLDCLSKIPIPDKSTEPLPWHRRPGMRQILVSSRCSLLRAFVFRFWL